MDRFTRTSRDTGTILAIPAQHPGLTCSRKRTLFASTVLACVITVTAKYLSFAGGQGWPAMPLVSCSMRPWPRPLALAQEASWVRTTPPLFDFSVYRARGREGINRGQSSNTWKQQQLLKLVKAVQDFSAGCSTSIEPQNDMLFIKYL